MIIDLVYGGLLAIALFRGFRFGLVFSIFWLISIVAGILAAVSLSHITASYLEQWFQIAPTYLPLVAFMLTMVLVVMLVRMLGKLMDGLFKMMQLNTLNKLAGAFVWGVIVSLLFSTVLWYANNMSLFTPELMADSKVFAPLISFAPLTMDIIGSLFPVAGSIFDSLQEWFDKAGQLNPSDLRAV